jgi:hypothetical protein
MRAVVRVINNDLDAGGIQIQCHTTDDTKGDNSPARPASSNNN